MVKLTIDQASVSRMVSNLTDKKNAVTESGKHGLASAAEQIFQDSQAHVPVGTGALLSSGKVTYKNTTHTVTATISYGDDTRNPNTNKPTSLYAVSRHESPNGGKWLENAILGGSEMFIETLSTEISSKL
jgi:hypothetical protein